MGLKPHWFHILLALAEGATHGAEVRRRVGRHDSGGLKLYPAMLYGSLEDLQEGGLIREVDGKSPRPAGSNERLRNYALTAAGRETLAVETRRLERVTRIARDALAEGRSR